MTKTHSPFASKPWENPEGTYRDSRWRDAREFETGWTVCEETGAGAVNGECPVHGGDACLYSAALLVTYWRERDDSLTLELAGYKAALTRVAKERDEALGAFGPERQRMTDK